jgi:heptosyltransferase-2
VTEPSVKIIVRMPNWIGDAVLALPALATLRAAYPEAEIWIAAREWVKDLIGPRPSVQGIVALPEVRNLKSLRKAARLVKAGGFDIGLLLTNSFASALVFSLAGVRERWGYARDGRRLLLTRAVRVRETWAPLSQRDYYLALLAGLGLAPLSGEIDLHVSAAEGKAADALLDTAGRDRSRPLVILNPGAAYGPAKRWPAERFAALAGLLRSRAGAEIALVGAPGDTSIADAIASAWDGKLLDFTGRTSLRELAGLITRARVFITNDTGPMHMANALKVPVVAIFGPTDPLRTGPFQPPSAVLKKDVPCWPCLYRACPYDHRCMTRIDPEEVFAACREFLP